MAILCLALAAIVPAHAAERTQAGERTQGAPGPTVPSQLNGLPQAFDRATLEAQILLDRAGFSPGLIDGVEGPNTEKARHAFQRAHGLEPGAFDERTRRRLAEGNGTALFRRYTIGTDEVNGPFVERIRDDFKAMAKMKRLAYHSPQELLAEKFHMSQALLEALNPDVDFRRAGATITVTAVNEPQAAAPSKEATRVVVDKALQAVRVHGPGDQVIAFYPATVGSKARPAPSGTLEVTEIVREPNYTYDPKYDFPGVRIEEPVTVPPGPNGPAGIAWIGLSKEGYGIHGTAEPGRVGKTHSYGCIRLTNWDALALMQLVRQGMPVEFVGDTDGAT